MENPWSDLPETPPFVLPSDERAVAAFNARSRPEHFLHLELIPEPFLGSPDAPIVLLNLNPGFDGRETRFDSNDAFFVQLSRNNLLHREQDFLFYLLNPRISGSLGYQWWARKLREPILAAGARKVARKVLCIEYFPYHSVRYKQFSSPLQSQLYSFHLARQAVARGALIVIMRGNAAWFDAVPELRSCPDAYSLNSAQNVTISLRNCPEGFPKIVRILAT